MKPIYRNLIHLVDIIRVDDEYSYNNITWSKGSIDVGCYFDKDKNVTYRRLEKRKMVILEILC